MIRPLQNAIFGLIFMIGVLGMSGCRTSSIEGLPIIVLPAIEGDKEDVVIHLQLPYGLIVKNPRATNGVPEQKPVEPHVSYT